VTLRFERERTPPARALSIGRQRQRFEQKGPVCEQKLRFLASLNQAFYPVSRAQARLVIHSSLLSDEAPGGSALSGIQKALPESDTLCCMG